MAAESKIIARVDKAPLIFVTAAPDIIKVVAPIIEEAKPIDTKQKYSREFAEMLELAFPKKKDN